MADDPLISSATGDTAPETREQTSGGHSGAHRQTMSAAPLNTVVASETWSSGTADEHTLSVALNDGHDENGMGGAVVDLSFNGGTCSAGKIYFEASFDDGATWRKFTGLIEIASAGAFTLVSELTLSQFAGAAVSGFVRLNVRGATHFRLRLETPITGTIQVTIGLVATTLAGPFIDGSLYAITGPGTDASIAVSVQGSAAMTPLKTTNAAASQADGHSATLGSTSDADTATTAIGLLKKLKALLNGGLPAALSGGRLDVVVGAALPAGSAAIGKLAANSGVDIGDVDVTSVPTDPFGANADAASATGSISAKLRQIAANGIPVTGTVTVDTELPAAAALADATSNPTVPGVGSFNMSWNGSTWDRCKVQAYKEDDAHNSGDFGIQTLTVRKDTPAAPAGSDGDYQPSLTDQIGRLWVAGHLCTRITVTPTVSTSPAYTSGDQIGGVQTYSSAGLFNGQRIRITGALCTNRDTDSPIIELWLFRVSPTMANADNGAFDLTDSNLETAEFVGVIVFSDWYNTSAGQACQGANKGVALSEAPIDFTLGSSTTSFYAVGCVRSTPTQAGTTDLIFSLFVERL